MKINNLYIVSVSDGVYKAKMVTDGKVLSDIDTQIDSFKIIKLLEKNELQIIFANEELSRIVSALTTKPTYDLWLKEKRFTIEK